MSGTSRMYLLITLLAATLFVGSVFVLIFGGLRDNPQTASIAATLPSPTTSPDDAEPHYLYQALPDGATLADQPQGYANQSVTFSADGRYAAFYARTDRAMTVIVRDLQTKTDTIVPAPNEKIFEARNIRFLAWDRHEPRLYILEEASPHAREIEKILSRPFETPVDRVKDLADTIYSVLYAWRPGAPDMQILDTFPAKILSISALDDGPCIAHVSPGKGSDFLDLRHYKNDRPAGTQTIAIQYPDDMQGQTLGRAGLRVLARYNEIWFTTMREDTRENWLIRIDLNHLEQEAKPILRGVVNFHWSRDEQSLFVSRIRGEYVNNEFDGEIDIARFQREALDKPTVLATKHLDHGDCFEFVAIGPDERSLYLYSQTQPKMRFIDLASIGAMQLYVLPIRTP